MRKRKKRAMRASLRDRLRYVGASVFCRDRETVISSEREELAICVDDVRVEPFACLAASTFNRPVSYRRRSRRTHVSKVLLNAK